MGEEGGEQETVRPWSTHEIRYLREHAGDGAKEIAKPLNKANGWCAECTKEGHVADLREQASAMREEAARSKRNDRERQRCYSAKSRAKKSQK